MTYDKELRFTEKLLDNFRLKISYIKNNPVSNQEGAQRIGLLNMLNFNITHDNLIERLKKICKSKTIYQVTTPFLCNYVIFQLPDTLEPEYAYIGPFTDNII